MRRLEEGLISGVQRWSEEGYWSNISEISSLGELTFVCLSLLLICLMYKKAESFVRDYELVMGIFLWFIFLFCFICLPMYTAYFFILVMHNDLFERFFLSNILF